MNAMVPGAPQNLEAAGGTGKVTLNGAAAPPLLRLFVACMQVDKGLPLRGALFATEGARGTVQLRQKECVLNELSQIQGRVLRCEDR